MVTPSQDRNLEKSNKPVETNTDASFFFQKDLGEYQKEAQTNQHEQEMRFACSRLSSQLSEKYNQEVVVTYGQDKNGKDCIFVRVGNQVVHSFDANKLNMDNLKETRNEIENKLNSFAEEDYVSGEREGETLDGYFAKWSVDTSKYGKFTESMKKRYGEKLRELGITDIRIGEEDGQLVIGYMTSDGKFYRQRANLAQLGEDGTLQTLSPQEKGQKCRELIEDFLNEELPASRLKTDQEKIDYAVARAEKILSQKYGENIKIELDPTVPKGGRSTPPCSFYVRAGGEYVKENGEPYRFNVQVWDNWDSTKLNSPNSIAQGIVRDVVSNVVKTDD